jgi:hypothetical protein
VDFETYLISKKIDRLTFLTEEPELFLSWKTEFEQMHPNSFTVQKLNLINPVRRKYPLKEIIMEAPAKTENVPVPTQAPAKPGRPVIKPKPKIS